jgi:hypothetical protein
MGRSARRCDTAICSPFKNSFLNASDKNGVKDSARPKNKFYVVPTGGGPSYSYSGKKKTDVENIAYPGRDRCMNTQLLRTGHNAHGGTRSVLRLRDRS